MEKREKIIRLVVSDDEHARLKAAADSDGHPLAAWARAKLLKIAKAENDEAS